MECIVLKVISFKIQICLIQYFFLYFYYPEMQNIYWTNMSALPREEEYKFEKKMQCRIEQIKKHLELWGHWKNGERKTKSLQICEDSLIKT